MRTKLAFVAALAFAAALPLAAGHRHGRDCGHYYSRAHGGWVAFSVAAPWGVGSYGRGFDRGFYGRDRYYDRRARKRYLKELRRRQRFARRYRRGRYCPY